MISKLRWVAAVGSLTLLIGCGDGIGPPTTPDPAREVRADSEMHMLRQALVPTTPEPGQHGALFETVWQPKALATYTGQFWAVRGEERSLSIAYADGAEFLTFTVPSGALQTYPDGTLFGTGDSVQVSITVDQALLLITMEPSGLTFSPTDPALLDLRYADADPDYNGDGTVNTDDADLEDDLTIWVQPENTTVWTVVSADQTLTTKRFVGYLFHFSNYTVSW